MSDLKIVHLQRRDNLEDASCRAALDEIAKRVEKMDSIAVVCVHGDGAVGSIFHVGRSVFELAGAIEMLAHRIQNEQVK